VKGFTNTIEPIVSLFSAEESKIAKKSRKMKLLPVVLAAAVVGFAAAQNFCTTFNTPETDMVMELTDLSGIQFSGLYPIVVNRFVGDPMIRIVRHTSQATPIMRGLGDNVGLITLPSCTTGSSTATPLTTSPATASLATASPATASPDASSASRYGASLSSVALMAGAYLSGASFTASVGIGTFAQIVLAQPVAAQEGPCINVVEIEIHGPAMDATALDVLESENAALTAKVAALEMMLNNSVSMDAATQMQIDVMVENFGRNGKSCFRVWTDLFVDMLEYKTCCSRPH
jgi:hypothetical protein